MKWFADRWRSLSASCAESGKVIWLIGGGELAGEFFAAGGVDRLSVFVHPILIHHGLPLAAGVPHDVRLSLTGTHAFHTGLVRLDYEVSGAWRVRCRGARFDKRKKLNR